ncbi:methyltransferase domain-containing protein [Anderseniella sp. Alg231-50]|uniref:methyltransferase domain-containing protein n=1 Tax=Anderseniella sp. Alg231-50 TaxID=1922226 RepID=UPI000D55ABCF
MTQPEELYPEPVIGFLEMLWGRGWLSPGGPDELARLLEGEDLRGKHVLDIGCGAGGIDCLLVSEYGAARITGIDVEASVLEAARTRIREAGISEHVELMQVEPGPLPFAADEFDVVFSKDAIVHIPGKHELGRDVFRVLKPGGRFVASDWLMSHDGEPSPDMQAYLASEDLDFGMASPRLYADALEQAGFVDVALTNRNAWYRDQARRELALLQGELHDAAIAELGYEIVDHNIQTWGLMIKVLETGEHCPHHVRGRKP